MVSVSLEAFLAVLIVIRKNQNNAHTRHSHIALSLAPARRRPAIDCTRVSRSRRGRGLANLLHRHTTALLDDAFKRLVKMRSHLLRWPPDEVDILLDGRLRL